MCFTFTTNMKEYEEQVGYETITKALVTDSLRL